MSVAFYNELEPYPAAWLRNLITAGHIAPGTVDERSVIDLAPEDLEGFEQCHFFAGIGVWSHALRLAGVPDDAPVWTGSCPCQPLSVAGKRRGADDERHLWPAWFRLIRERRPATIFGEQVASRAGLEWFDAVRSDLEACGYAVAAADLPAASVGAPHIRQRLFFVAFADVGADRRLHARREDGPRAAEHAGAGAPLVDTEELGRGARDFGGAPPAPDREGERRGRTHARGDARDVEHAERSGLEGHAGHGGDGREPGRLDALEDRPAPAAGAPSGVAGFWAGCDWIPCRDGKARPVEPGAFPLAHGVAARVGKLRAYGNAIEAQTAAAFIRAARSAIEKPAG